MSSFGEAVLAAREARGWTQRDLAVRAGVSQRAVSSWERGVSEPREATKRAVAGLLHLQPDNGSPAVARRSPSGGALLAELPFEDLDPGEFEDFAVTLARSLYPAAEAYRQGKSGHAQHGFDVVVERDGEVVAGIQCKRVREFGPKEVTKAVDAATMKVGTALIFLSRAASPDARSALSVHRGWQLWDRNKLSHAVHEMPIDRAVALVDRYFPLLREKFLGLPLPGPWLSPSQYFSRTGRSERSSHQWPLVGRDDLLADLAHFAKGPAGRIGVLIGRGGTGKTKMLHALCEGLSGEQINVIFMERDAVIDGRAFEQLPAGRLLLIIDDAHDEDAPIGKVVAGTLATNVDASVLLSLRPDGESRSRRQLREFGLDPSGNRRWELADLHLAESESLACEVLGQSGYAAARLATAARDCPFLLVTGAIMVREGSIDLARFEGDDRLRRELIESLTDAISSRAIDQAEVRDEVLRAASALQPLRTADSDFREALEELTGRAFDQIVPHLSAWEDVGILLRRGQTYRIVPDLLGDALLARAARARETGAPTGYIDRVRGAAKGAALANLIVNASRIDWQEPVVDRGRLVASIWNSVTDEFKAGDAEARVAVLNVLAKVAFFQPRPTLRIVRWALEHPATPVEVQATFGFSYECTDQGVRDAVAPVLRSAAYDPGVLREAADLLWELARSDPRRPSQHPNHALRVLADLATFDRRGVTIFQQSLPAIAERWLRHPRRETDAHDPLTVLHPLLATEGHEQTWNLHALTIRPFLIDPDAPQVIELRRQVLDLAFEQLGAGSLRRVVSAIETISAGLTGPHGGFGLVATDHQRAPWAKYFRRTLMRLRDAVRAHPPAPAVSVTLREHLQWPAEHVASEIHEASRDVLAMLPRAPEYELARGLRGGPIDPPPDSSASMDYLDRQRANEQFLSACTATVANWPNNEVIDLIERVLDDLRGAVGEEYGRARPFIWTLVTTRPGIGEALCARVEHTPGGPIVPLLSTVLTALALASSRHLVDMAYRLLGTGQTDLARQVAFAFGLQRARDTLLEGEPAILRALVEHDDPEGIVPVAALGAVRFIAAQHRDLAVDLLTRVPDNRKGNAIGEFVLAFGPHGALAWKDLAQHHKDAFLAALRAAPSIESYEIGQFLAMLSLHDPYTVIDLLAARVETMETSGESATFTPLPHAWQTPLRFRDRDDFPDLLRRAREWLAAAPDSPWRQYLGSELFAAVAGPFDAQTRQVIEEYLSEPDPIRIRTASTILRSAPRALVWDTDFVRACLHAADACGAESLAAMQSALHSSVFAGGRSAAIGQPYPEDLEQRDTAAQLAIQAVPGSVEEQFYRALSQSAEHWIDLDISEINIPEDGRDW